MPKRIPYLSETIVTVASQLFSQLGYDAVDMKQVAAGAGTSVGNLYNYFPSKPELFLAIKARWRSEILASCRDVMGSALPRREKVLAIVQRLYDDMARWHALWAEFVSGREERARLGRAKLGGLPGPAGAFEPEEVEFLAQLEALLLPVHEPVTPRWSILLILATVQMAKRFPQQREDNWKFLETLVDKI